MIIKLMTKPNRRKELVVVALSLMVYCALPIFRKPNKPSNLHLRLEIVLSFRKLSWRWRQVRDRRDRCLQQTVFNYHLPRTTLGTQIFTGRNIIRNLKFLFIEITRHWNVVWNKAGQVTFLHQARGRWLQKKRLPGDRAWCSTGHSQNTDTQDLRNWRVS